MPPALGAQQILQLLLRLSKAITVRVRFSGGINEAGFVLSRLQDRAHSIAHSRGGTSCSLPSPAPRGRRRGVSWEQWGGHPYGLTG